VRSSVRSGRPYGAEDWVEVISHRLGIVREPRRRGRPPREKMLRHRNSSRNSSDTGIPHRKDALTPESPQGREVEMTVQCQNRANCAGVYRCQIRTYDEKMGGPTGALATEETSESLLERNRFAVGQKRNTGVSHGFIFRPWPFL